jgi:hypothetical protein
MPGTSARISSYGAGTLNKATDPIRRQVADQVGGLL